MNEKKEKRSKVLHIRRYLVSDFQRGVRFIYQTKMQSSADVSDCMYGLLKHDDFSVSAYFEPKNREL